jgi:hypothetical protein
MKPKKRFTKQNQLKKESKEMNSKVKVPRIQETKVFVPKSPNQTKMELKTTWNPSREMKEEETWKNQKTRNSKLDVKSL